MKKYEAIIKVNPSIVVIRGDDAFDEAGNPVSYDEATVQAYMDTYAYIEKRQRKYPSIPDQLDLLYHGGMDAWKAAITAVKEEFPK